MQFTHFVGIDVSKHTLDISLANGDGKIQCHYRIKNTVKDIKAGIEKLLKEQLAMIDSVLFCTEHTGIYTIPLLTWLKQQDARVWLESGMQITKSQGLTRGKNDKIDSARIALYAFTYRHNVDAMECPQTNYIQANGFACTAEQANQSKKTSSRHMQRAKKLP